MASTIISSSLKIRIIEDITLNGRDRGSDNTIIISSINEVDNRIVTLPSGSETTLFALSGSSAAGTFVSSSLKYARVTNKDDSVEVRLRISSSNDYSSDYRLDPGSSFLLSNTKVSGSSTGVSNINNYDEIYQILGEPSGADAEVEVFVASL